MLDGLREDSSGLTVSVCVCVCTLLNLTDRCLATQVVNYGLDKDSPLLRNVVKGSAAGGQGRAATTTDTEPDSVHASFSSSIPFRSVCLLLFALIFVNCLVFISSTSSPLYLGQPLFFIPLLPKVFHSDLKVVILSIDEGDFQTSLSFFSLTAAETFPIMQLVHHMLKLSKTKTN